MSVAGACRKSATSGCSRFDKVDSAMPVRSATCLSVSPRARLAALRQTPSCGCIASGTSRSSMPNLSETVRRLPGKQPIHPTILSAGHPGFGLSLGKDEAEMPFGLQIVGPRGGDAIVLARQRLKPPALMTPPCGARSLTSRGCRRHRRCRRRRTFATGIAETREIFDVACVKT
jgi:hypothetical protein